jgi:DNA recombination protein RmuC
MLWLIAALFILLSVIIVSLVLKVSSQVNERLKEMNQSLQQANRDLAQNLGSTANIFGSVEEKLGRLEETNRQICEISKDISSLQNLLRAPKFRGEIGETLLESLLSQVLPKEYFQVQYKFKTSDTVDAVIRLADKLVPIDAKFPLENFQRLLAAVSEEDKQSYRKSFISDVKSRIEEIASKYILPQEDTYDFALMYIPAENVYYEIIIKENLLSFAMQKKIIPVSPNTFYAYLQIICLGLKGLKVEENAKQILKSLSALTNDVDKLKDDFNLLGSHLNNASRKFDDSQKRIGRLSDKLINIQEKKIIESK